MKWFLLGGALLVIIVGAILAIFYSPSTSSTGGAGSYNFPTASSTGIFTGGTSGGNGSTTTTGTSSPSFTIATQSGTLTVNDFIHNGKTAPDPQNPNIYYLAGNFGAPANDYAISYDPSTAFFTVALTAEPIAQARLHAEQFLEAALGVSESSMCSLKYYLGTDVYTNSFYGGENLGFSFCPGATELPQ